MRRLCLAVLAACSLSGCAQDSAKLPVQPIPMLGGGQVSLASCPTTKCLTVVLAPWCGYCRAATPMLQSLRTYLTGRGTDVRVVIGQDQPEALREYAAVFGPATALDELNLLRPRGVPQFYVSDNSGSILKAMAGAPQTDDVQAVAAYFGL
jgi:hypothetical protein